MSLSYEGSYSESGLAWLLWESRSSENQRTLTGNVRGPPLNPLSHHTKNRCGGLETEFITLCYRNIVEKHKKENKGAIAWTNVVIKIRIIYENIYLEIKIV